MKRPTDLVGHALAKEKKFRTWTSNFCFVIFLIAFVLVGIFSSWWVSIGVFIMILMAQVMLQQNYVFTKRFDDQQVEHNVYLDGKAITSKINDRNTGFRK